MCPPRLSGCGGAQRGRGADGRADSPMARGMLPSSRPRSQATAAWTSSVHPAQRRSPERSPLPRSCQRIVASPARVDAPWPRRSSARTVSPGARARSSATNGAHSERSDRAGWTSTTAGASGSPVRHRSACSITPYELSKSMASGTFASAPGSGAGGSIGRARTSPASGADGYPGAAGDGTTAAASAASTAGSASGSGGRREHAGAATSATTRRIGRRDGRVVMARGSIVRSPNQEPPALPVAAIRG